MVAPNEILNARICIVDDNESNVFLLEETLATGGYTSVISVTDPRKVAELYTAYQPDLVLLDINMPYMNGYQVMEKLRELTGDDYPPVLVLTAQQDRETRLRSLQSGAKDFLSKPFDHAETLTRIRNMLEARLLHMEVKNQNIILERKVAERTAELHNTQMEIIRRLGLAAEYKDNETGLHIIRMSKMCQAIGVKAGREGMDTDILLNASPMHDIGKIGIPDRILQKPGKLDPEEWKIMKTHTSIGAQMLDGHSSALLIMAREIALTHHEKWDGSGYPNCLKGEEIPLPGRICAIADVFDALTSVRPYKKAWSIEDSVAEIKKGKGTLFDPELVDVFMSVLDEIVLIRKKFREPS